MTKIGISWNSTSLPPDVIPSVHAGCLGMPVVPGQHVGNWVTLKKLGKGSFGELWLGQDSGTKTKVAIKFERHDIPTPQLTLEYQRYKELGDSQYVPKFYRFLLVEGTEYHAIVMELLSKSLENLLDVCDRTFSLKTTLQLAIQMITILQFIHNKKIIHRDIKPDNFMFGRKETGKDKKLMIIDFGLSKCYIENGKHIKYETDKAVMGSFRYMSLNGHNGIQQSRRDDLESIGYVFLYFLNGKLPWQGIDADDAKIRNKLVGDKKRSMPPEKLCEGQPPEFAMYFRKVKELKFKEDPHYQKYIDLFMACAKNNSIEIDTKFDWDGKIDEQETVRIKPETKSNMKQRSQRKTLF